MANKFFTAQPSLSYMSDSLSDFMVHSTALANSSQYDVYDDRVTVSTWIEETIQNTMNWYFVLPNVTTDNNKATVIKLFHGCTICWDASKIRHASSKVQYRLRGGGTSAGNCELRKKNRRKP